MANNRRTGWKRRAVGRGWGRGILLSNSAWPWRATHGHENREDAADSGCQRSRPAGNVPKPWQVFIHDAMNQRAVRRCGRVWKTVATHASIARRRQGYDSVIGVGRLFSVDRCCAELCDRRFAWRTFALRAGPGDAGRTRPDLTSTTGWVLLLLVPRQKGTRLRQLRDQRARGNPAPSRC